MRLNSNPPGTRKHDDLKQFDRKAGVYLLLKGRQVYIGSTRDLRARLRSHASRYGGWEVIAEPMPLRQARAKEGELIRAFVTAGKFKILNTNRVLESLRIGVSRQLFHARMKRGWSEQQARTTPPRGYG